MTVHARRYARWCREHFDVAAADRIPDPRGQAGPPAEAAEPDLDPLPAAAAETPKMTR